MTYLFTTNHARVLIYFNSNTHKTTKVIVSFRFFHLSPSNKEIPPTVLTVTLTFTCISYVVDARKMTFNRPTPWKRRLTSAKCQNDVGTAPPAEKLKRKLLTPSRTRTESDGRTGGRIGVTQYALSTILRMLGA